MALRLAFFGTPEFACPTLAALLEAGHDVAAVYSQPPRPAGRGHRTVPSPVHRLAESRDLSVRTPRSLRDAAVQAAFATLGLDAAVVVAYGLILPREVLDAPRLGCLNVHASLLPRWRGAAPIHRALLAGDAETGICIMQMDAGLDTGPVLLREAVTIGPRETAAALHDRLAQLGARMIGPALAGRAAGTLTTRPQPEEGVTYAPKLTRDEGRLDWTRTAVELDRCVRALAVWPGTGFTLQGERIKVLEATPLPDGTGAPPGARPGMSPGTVVDDALTVACGEGRLRLDRLQRPGRGPLRTVDFLRGFPIPPGTLLPPG